MNSSKINFRQSDTLSFGGSFITTPLGSPKKSINLNNSPIRMRRGSTSVLNQPFAFKFDAPKINQ